MLTCGRPLAVSSILTATTPFLLGFPPVSGFFVGPAGPGFGFGLPVPPAPPVPADEDADEELPGEAEEPDCFGLSLPLPLHADSTRAAVHAATANPYVAG